ncbi:MAG TPA: hypothetical protein VJ397_04525 [Thermoplasmata archaeon]|nr:hypothetical protein [Thermoplasmata archaeon]
MADLDSLVYVLGLYGMMILAAVGLAIAFLPRFRFAFVKGDPEKLRTAVAYRLRLERYPVAEQGHQLAVRLGKASVAKLYFRLQGADTEVRWRADATPWGWGVLILLVFFSGGAPIISHVLGGTALVSTAYLLVRARQFVRRFVRPLLVSPRALEPPRTDDVRASLITGLSEAHRLASEGLDAELSSRSDDLAVAGLGGVLVWAALFILLFQASAEADFARRVGDAAFPALIAGISAAVMVGALLFQRYGRSLAILRAWTERLHTALSKEIAAQPGGEAEPSTFEVLAEASVQVRPWLSSARRAGYGRDLGSWFLLFVIGFWGVYATVAGVGLALTANPWVGFAALTAGLVLLWATASLHRRRQRSRDQDIRQATAEWQKRFDGARTAMEQYLQGL